MKRCATCGEHKKPSEFYKNKLSKDGLCFQCAMCASARARAHRDDCKRRGVLNGSQLTQQRLRLQVLTHYGGDPPTCACCGETHIEFLAIDHIHGGGAKHKAAIRKRGTGLYLWLRRNGWPTGFRVLCCNCNQSLGAYGYCPHKHKGPRCVPTRKMPKEVCQARILLAIQTLRGANEKLTTRKVAEISGVGRDTVYRYHKLWLADGRWPAD